MATWIGAYLTAPLVLVSGLFMYKVVTDQQKSYARMSFKSFDVRFALQLIMFGFLVLSVGRVYDFAGFQRLNFVASVLTGSIATVLITAAFLILNGVVYGPKHFLYTHLPSNYLSRDDIYV